MKIRLISIASAFVVAAAVILGYVLLSPSLFKPDNTISLSSSPTATTSNIQSTATGGANPIVKENTLTGTTQWQIEANHVSDTQIQAFAGATSVAPGKSIKFYVSTRTAGTQYTIDIYRMGWYEGNGARLMQSIPNNSGEAQGYFASNDQATSRLVCQSCTLDTKTGLLETHWKASYTLTVPASWTTGIYLAKFSDADSWQTYAPFDVLGSSTSAYLLMTPDTTAAAYNAWGGSSLYSVDDEDKQQNVPISPGAGVAAVSFNKPYLDGNGSGLVTIFELPTIRWLERQGYDIAYISSTDLHTNVAQILNHKALLSIGHDEYWTKEMRDGLEAARDHGVGLAFLGANTGYWQMRFEPDSAGVADRTIVCYKVQKWKGEADLQRDPLYGQDNSRVTGLWRESVIDRPEEELTGVMFSNLTHDQAGFAWTVDAQANSPLLTNTGLQAGQSYGCGIVGYEWDKVFNDAHTPKGLQILSSTTVTAEGSTQDTSNSAYYISSSGALVFASGSIYWSHTLDDYRATATQGYYRNQLAAACGGDAANSRAVPEIQKLMTNVMEALIIKHPGGHL